VNTLVSFGIPRVIKRGILKYLNNKEGENKMLKISCVKM
jgi:hypothetical protein